MRNCRRKPALLFLAGMLALALVALLSATETGSSEAQQGAMQNCPQAGKWAIAVWDGNDGTDAAQALATCGEGAVAVAYSIDPDTQVWARWFAGRPEISNLTAVDNMQGVMALGGTGATATPTPSPTPTPTVVEGVSVDDDPSWGPEDAPVTIIEFSEFLCPYCQRFAVETLPQIKQTYEGKVRYVYRDFIIHGEPALKISEAAECADDQEKFWEYHDHLWENYQTLGQQAQTGMDALASTLKGYASDLELDTATFNDCLDTGKHTAEVQKDSQDAQSYGARGTPAFFINGQLVSGAQPYSVFQQVIDAALEEAEAGSPAQGDTMRNCPQAGKWAIAVWDGNDGTDAEQAFATCGQGAVAVAYSIDPDTQVWSRWFAGRPEISNLTALNDMQGVMALGGTGAPATPTPSPTPTPTPTATPTPTPAAAGGPPTDYLDTFHAALEMSVEMDMFGMDFAIEGDFEAPNSCSCDLSATMWGIPLIEQRVIVIGNKAWIDTGDGWRETTPSDPEVAEAIGICPACPSFWEDFAFEAPPLAGEHETKNGVPAIHYTLAELYEAFAGIGLIPEEMEGVSVDTLDVWVAEDGKWLVCLDLEMTVEGEALEEIMGEVEVESVTLAMSVDITRANDPSIEVNVP